MVLGASWGGPGRRGRLMSVREVRFPFSRFAWLKEVICVLHGHEEHCVPASATEDYVGTYCLRCGAHWNHAVQVSRQTDP